MGARILVVDDSRVTRRIIAGYLQEAGYRHVEQAGDGREALEKLEGGEFDLVLTDWNMPHLDGLELIRRIRGQERFRTLPILLVTSRQAEEDVLRALEAGANHYIAKPFAAGALCEKVAALLPVSATEGEG